MSAREHAPGDLVAPHRFELMEGEPRASNERIGIVVARFNGDVTSALLEAALSELTRIGIHADQVTTVAVPGAYELPPAALKLAETRRYACIVALGCVIRGETAHFDHVAGAAATGIQQAALQTGVPITFGVLTVDNHDQARARIETGASAVRAALEMAELFRRIEEQS